MQCLWSMLDFRNKMYRLYLILFIIVCIYLIPVCCQNKSMFCSDCIQIIEYGSPVRLPNLRLIKYLIFNMFLNENNGSQWRNSLMKWRLINNMQEWCTVYGVCRNGAPCMVYAGMVHRVWCMQEWCTVYGVCRNGAPCMVYVGMVHRVWCIQEWCTVYGMCMNGTPWSWLIYFCLFSYKTVV